MVDTQAPAVSAPSLLPASDTGVSSSDNITNVTLPTFTGTAETGATVSIFEGTTLLGTAVATGGAYSITLTTPLVDGQHIIIAKASDAAGNTSSASAPLVVTIDTTAPAVGPAVLSAASDSGASDHDGVTNVTHAGVPRHRRDRQHGHAVRWRESAGHGDGNQRNLVDQNQRAGRRRSYHHG